MTKLNKKTILNDFDNMLERFDIQLKENGDFIRERDVYLSFLVKTYKTSKQRIQVADTIAGYVVKTDDENLDHWSLAMDVIGCMTFLAGDLDNTEFLLNDVKPHPTNNLRALISKSVQACRDGMMTPKGFEGAFNV
jgi:hypothetical protein